MTDTPASDGRMSTPGFSSAAEERVWRILHGELGADDVILANVRLSDRAGDHEGDLVLGLAGAGIAVVEVKGGRVAHNGTDWVQHGRISRPIDPVGQARRVKYALRSFLDSDPAWDRRRVRMAHLVAFPYSTVPRGLSLPDCPRWMVLDKNDLTDSPLERIREALTRQETEAPALEALDAQLLARCLASRLAAPGAQGPSGVGRHPTRRRLWAGAAAALAATGLLVAGVAQWSATAGPESTPLPSSPTDPRFATCLQAKAAGYGMYARGRDAEYAWYRDLDGDGVVCE